MRNRGAALLLSLCLAGCSVGPKYHRPSAPVPPAYKEKPPANSMWKKAHPDDGALRLDWWTEFGDARLNDLERKVPIANQNVQQAEAAFRQARALVAFNRAQYYPQIGTGPSISVAQGSGTLGSGAISSSTSTAGSAGRIAFYNLPFTVSWQPNFWGSISLAVDNSVYLAQASAAQVQNILLSMQADLATDYFSMESINMQETLFRETIAAYETDLRLTQLRFEFGIASIGDVAAAQAQLEATRAALTDLAISREQFANAIAVLTGVPPDELKLGPGKITGAPPAIPAGLPSQLLERRPDIAEFERNVAAANAQVGLARVAYFPAVTLSATGGFESTSISKWLTWPSHFWSAGVGVSETLLDFGRRHAQVGEAKAAYDQTVATYRQTVLTAFQEVDDALAALRELEVEEAQQAAAVKAANQSARVAELQYKSGTVAYLNVITAQAIELADERALVQIQGRRYTSTVQLILALGGGWNVLRLPPPSVIKKPH